MEKDLFNLFWKKILEKNQRKRIFLFYWLIFSVSLIYFISSVYSEEVGVSARVVVEENNSVITAKIINPLEKITGLASLTYEISNNQKFMVFAIIILSVLVAYIIMKIKNKRKNANWERKVNSLKCIF